MSEYNNEIVYHTGYKITLLMILEKLRKAYQRDLNSYKTLVEQMDNFTLKLLANITGEEEENSEAKSFSLRVRNEVIGFLADFGYTRDDMKNFSDSSTCYRRVKHPPTRMYLENSNIPGKITYDLLQEKMSRAILQRKQNSFLIHMGDCDEIIFIDITNLVPMDYDSLWTYGRKFILTAGKLGECGETKCGVLSLIHI